MALAMGYRTWNMVAAVFLINLVTNPAANVIYRVGCRFHWLPSGFVTLIPLEILIVLVEWPLLSYTFCGRRRQMFILSLAMNSASFLAGLLIYGV